MECTEHFGPSLYKIHYKSKKGRNGLRYGKSIVLEKPKTKLSGCGDGAFCKTAPVLWNNLTHELRNTEKIDTFKSRQNSSKNIMSKQ